MPSPRNWAWTASWHPTPISPGDRRRGGASLFLITPFDGNPATAGNGVMVALAAKDQAQVDRVHALALSLGGKDEGAPGPRGGGFYAAYFRDLDGNKLNAFISG